MSSSDNFLAIFFGAFFGGSFLIIGLVFSIVYCTIWKPMWARQRVQEETYRRKQKERDELRQQQRSQQVQVPRDYGVTPILGPQVQYHAQPQMLGQADQMPVPIIQPSAPQLETQLPSYTELMGKKQ